MSRSSLTHLRALFAASETASSCSSSSSFFFDVSTLQHQHRRAASGLASVHAPPLPVKSGPGGRSSVSGVTATVFGGTGFLGRYVVNALGNRGSQVVVPNRSEEDDVQHLKVMGDLGQIVLLGPRFNIMSESDIKHAISRSNVVINLIGAKFENWNWKFDEVHVNIAERIAKCTKEVGVAQQFIHVSHLAADPHSSSVRLRTKAQGEAAVRGQLADATIIKAGPMCGEEDTFINELMRQVTSKRVPLINGGTRRVQPVWVKDVSEAINRIVEFPRQNKGKTFHLAGPQVYTEEELVGLIQGEMRSFDYRTSLPKSLAMLTVKPYQMLRDRLGLPIALHPVFGTVEDVEEKTIDMVAPVASTSEGGASASASAPASVHGFQDLGMTPASIMSSQVIDFIRHYRDAGYDFGETVGSMSGSRYAPGQEKHTR